VDSDVEDEVVVPDVIIVSLPKDVPAYPPEDVVVVLLEDVPAVVSFKVV
jgi:hypothetical protein